MTFVYNTVPIPSEPGETEDVLQYPACFSNSWELMAYNEQISVPFNSQINNLRKEASHNWKRGLLIGGLGGAFLAAIVTNAIVTGVI